MKYKIDNLDESIEPLYELIKGQLLKQSYDHSREQLGNPLWTQFRIRVYSLLNRQFRGQLYEI